MSVIPQVTAGQTADPIATVDATDPNTGDTLTYTIAAGTAPAGVAVDSATGAITWTTPVFSTTGEISITVSDGTTESTYAPQVAMCDCKNGKSAHQL